MPFSARRAGFALLALMWAALIWHLSSQPGVDIPPLFQHQDKLMHICAYAVLGILVTGALQQQARDVRMSLIITAVLLAGIYGIVDEYHQSFVPGRDSSSLDALADVTGALLGALLMRLCAQRKA